MEGWPQLIFIEKCEKSEKIVNKNQSKNEFSEKCWKWRISLAQIDIKWIFLQKWFRPPSFVVQQGSVPDEIGHLQSAYTFVAAVF